MERIENVRYKLLYILEKANNKILVNIADKLVGEIEELEAELAFYVQDANRDEQFNQRRKKCGGIGFYLWGV